jgi:hypothetical protein
MINLHSLIEQHNQESEGPPLTVKDHACTLLVNQEHPVILEESLDGQSLYLYAEVGMVPSDDREQHLEAALAGNLFGRETGKAALAYDKGKLVLSQRAVFMGLTLESLKQELSIFISYLNYWKDRLSDVPELRVSDFSMDRHLSGLTTHQQLEIFPV